MPIAPRSVVLLALSGIVLFALGLRTGVAAVAPLAGEVELDVPLAGFPLGALGTIPPVAYAMSASISPWLAKRIGIEWAALAMGVLGAIAHIWRGLSPSYASLFAATIVVMLAAGVGNVILPGLVKLYAPRAIGPVTAAYTTAMAISSASPTVLGLWMADEWGWRVSLGSWAIISLLGAIPWLFVLPFATRRGSAEVQLANGLAAPAPALSLWRSPTAVSIMAIFTVSSATAYTWFALLPAILIDVSGLSIQAAGLALGLFAILGLPLSIVVPPLAAKRGSAPYFVAAATVFGVVGIGGLLLSPTAGTFVWVTFLGLAPLAFHLSLTLIGQRTRDHRGALAVSGFVNTMGYLFAAAVPVLVGLVFELTGSWTIPLVLLGGIVLAQVPAIAVLTREGPIEVEVEQQG